MFNGSISQLTATKAHALGLSTDQRIRKRQHRNAAKDLLSSGGFMNGFSAPGSSFHSVAMWHLRQARLLAQR